MMVCQVGQQNHQDQSWEFPLLLVLRISKRFLLMKWQSYGFWFCETQLRGRGALRQMLLKGDKIKSQLHLALIIWDLIFKIFSFLSSPSNVLYGSWLETPAWENCRFYNTLGKPNPLSQWIITHAVATISQPAPILDAMPGSTHYPLHHLPRAALRHTDF